MASRKPKRPSQPTAGSKTGRVGVLIEMAAAPSAGMVAGMQTALTGSVGSLQFDDKFEPVPMSGNAQGLASAAAPPPPTTIVRGFVDAADIPLVEQQPGVVKVWIDAEIQPFTEVAPPLERSYVTPGAAPAAGTCPIAPCDCTPSTPKGAMTDVQNYLRVPQIWATGRRGKGMVVAVVDGGITAVGRATNPGDTGHPGWPNKLVPNVVGGFPLATWGTTGAAWGWHGNMCATDVLGMAPEVKILDIRISGAPGIPGTISAALAGFQWCIDQFRRNGTPQVITNSWGIFQEAWDRIYARDPNHPFTRKVVEALDAGILVLFAAGNCGDTCPDNRCASDIGTGRSIWGANGHPRVMTVGAVNVREEFIGYSSRGPAALDPNKPDFCSISHFTGYFSSDTGTSAATPILAGVVALLKQAKPTATQDQIKNCLKRTAKNIGAPGFDHDTGSGIVQPKSAFDCLVGGLSPGRLTWPRWPWGDRRTFPGVDRITIKGLDDRGTLKQIEDVKHPARDKILVDRRIVRDPLRDPVRQSGTPFVLATPHHADVSAIEGTGDLAAIEYEAEELMRTMEAVQQRLAELEAAFAMAQGDGEQQEYDGQTGKGPCGCKE